MLSTARRLNSRKPNRGAIVVLVAVCMAVLLSFVALTIDGGGLLEQRRRAQAAADAAALAGAEDLFRNYPTNQGADTPGTAAARAEAIAAANGFTNTAPSHVMIRTNPQMYLGGPNQGKVVPKGVVEVTVQ